MNHDKSDNKSSIYVVMDSPPKVRLIHVRLMESTRRRPVRGFPRVDWWAIRHTTISDEQCNRIPYQQRQQRHAAAQHWSRSDPDVAWFGFSESSHAPTAKRSIDSGHDPDNRPTRPTQDPEVKKLFGNIPRPISPTVGWTIWNLSLQIRIEETNGAEGNIDVENRNIYNILVRITNQPDKNFSFAVNNQMSSVSIKTHPVLNCISKAIRYHNTKNCIFINTSQAPIKFSVPSIFITNECHITNKVVQLCGVVAINSPSLVLITESWLDSTIPDSVVAIGDSYSTYRRDRPTPGGSVLDYVNTNIPTTRLHVWSWGQDGRHLFIWLLLKSTRIPRPFSSILVDCVYYPPGQFADAGKRNAGISY